MSANGRNITNMPPADDAFAIVPNDSADLATIGVCLSCLVAGNAKVTTQSGTELTIALAPGAVFPLRVRRVHSTDTTATGIFGLIV